LSSWPLPRWWLLSGRPPDERRSRTRKATVISVGSSGRHTWPLVRAAIFVRARTTAVRTMFRTSPSSVSSEDGQRVWLSKPQTPNRPQKPHPIQRVVGVSRHVIPPAARANVCARRPRLFRRRGTGLALVRECDGVRVTRLFDRALLRSLMIMNGPGAVHSSLPFARRCRLVEEGPGREVEPAIPHR
jgi:hypothetical protein